MNFLLELAQQPLFKLLGAIIVLLLTDMKPLYGLGAGLLWLVWVVLGVHASKQGRRIY
jgi:hypothetical protein